MCELFVVNPERVTEDRLATEMMDSYGRNDDGIGLVAIYNEGETFEYETLKQAEGDVVELYKWMTEKWDEVWRIIGHTRLATCGGVGHEQTHPIKVDCEKCGSGMIVHNGVIRRFGEGSIDGYEDEHDMTTRVDSEVIFHEQELPDSVDEATTIDSGGVKNYLVLREEGILLRHFRGYNISDDMEMSKRSSLVSGGSKSVRWLLAKPGDEVETETTNKINYKRKSSSRVRSKSSSSKFSSSSSSSSSRKRRVGGRIDPYVDDAPELTIAHYPENPRSGTIPEGGSPKDFDGDKVTLHPKPLPKEDRDENLGTVWEKINELDNCRYIVRYEGNQGSFTVEGKNSDILLYKSGKYVVEFHARFGNEHVSTSIEIEAE